MNMTITIAVFPRVLRPGGIATEGEPEIIEISEDDILKHFRSLSTIELHRQRACQIQNITFE